MTTTQPKKRKFSVTEKGFIVLVAILLTLPSLSKLEPYNPYYNIGYMLGSLAIRLALLTLIYAGIRWTYRKINDYGSHDRN